MRLTRLKEKEKIKLMDILNLCFLKKLQPHRTQVLWGLRQGSYPLALYVWSVTKIREGEGKVKFLVGESVITFEVVAAELK